MTVKDKLLKMYRQDIDTVVSLLDALSNILSQDTGNPAINAKATELHDLVVEDLQRLHGEYAAISELPVPEVPVYQ